MLEFPHAFVAPADGKTTVAATATAEPGLQRFLDAASVYEVAGSKRLLWFGEYHSEARLCRLLEGLTEAMLLQKQQQRESAQLQSRPQLHVVLEHFTPDMQEGLLDPFFNSCVGGQAESSAGTPAEADFAVLKRRYEDEFGTEGHDLDPYRELFQRWRHADCVKVHGGFVPRPLAAAFTRVEAAGARAAHLRNLMAAGYLPPEDLMRKVEECLRSGGTWDDFRLALELASPADEDGEQPAARAAGTGAPPATAWGHPSGLLYGSFGCFRLFESLLGGGEDLYTDAGFAGPSPAAKAEFLRQRHSLLRMFGAQCIKDWTMAYQIFRLMHGDGGSSRVSAPTQGGETRVLVVAGKAHLHHYQGVPQCLQLLRRAAGVAESLVPDELLVCSTMMCECDLDEPAEKRDAAIVRRKVAAGIGASLACHLLEPRLWARPYADVLFVYDEAEDEEDDSNSRAGQDEALSAYNRVGETAHVPGSGARARKWLAALGYTAEDMAAIGGSNLYNFQGVGNPFPSADIQPGDRVLELGCGLGVDAFLAAAKATAAGGVVAVDFALKELQHARERAQAEGRTNIRFVHGDFQRLSEILAPGFRRGPPAGISAEDAGMPPSDQFDVCISNGAFCLVPDKRKAFAEVFRMLRPGGRMAVCTTVLRGTSLPLSRVQDGGIGEGGRSDATKELEYPICMRLFAKLPELEPMLQGLGFSDVRIDEVQGLEGAGFEDDDENETEGRGGGQRRFKIHGGPVQAQYRHLEEMDVDAMCAAVVVSARKR